MQQGKQEGREVEMGVHAMAVTMAIRQGVNGSMDEDMAACTCVPAMLAAFLVFLASTCSEHICHIMCGFKVWPTPAVLPQHANLYTLSNVIAADR